jgi:hypothetical protein
MYVCDTLQGVSMKVSNCVEGSAECVVCPDGDSSCYASSSNQNASP